MSMNLGKNSVMPQFVGAGSGGGASKMQNLLFLKPMDIESESVQHIKKINLPKSIRRRDMEVFPLRDLEKGLFLPYLPSKLS